MATADAYFTGISNVAWATATVPDKEQHLIIGSAYVDNQQVYSASGTRQTLAQWMAWPRLNATHWNGGLPVPIDTIPIEYQQACIVAAGLSLDGELPTEGGNSAPGGIEVKKEKVDVIEVEYFHSSQGKDSTSSAGAIGLDAIAAYGHPDVTGLIIPLLNQAALVDPNAGTGVTRAEASRRGTFYLPTDTPPAFSRGMLDTSPLAEDKTMAARER